MSAESISYRDDQSLNAPGLLGLPAGSGSELAANPLAVSILLLAFAMMSFGIVMLAAASASQTTSILSDQLWQTRLGRQLIYMAVGIVLMMITYHASIPLLSQRWFVEWMPVIVFLLTMAGLVLVLIPGVANAQRGSHRWLQLGPIPFAFQPSEAAKPALIVMLAWILASRRSHVISFTKAFLPAGMCVLLTVGLVGKENLSTACILGFTGFCMMLLAGCHWLYMTLMCVAGVSGGLLLLWMEPYRMDRITGFLTMWEDPQGKGYHAVQSLITIASGGWTGQGLGYGIQKYGYVPESHTDFIFAVICEETGVMGGLLVIGMVGVLTILGWSAVDRARSPFERMVAMGLVLWLVVQSLLNIAVVTALAPTTGISLPFISAGGSGLLVSAASVGLLAAIAARSRPVPVRVIQGHPDYDRDADQESQEGVA